MKNTTNQLGIIALVAVIGFFVMACNKADPETDFYFEPSSNSQGMVITGYKGNNVNVVIPAKIQKLPVVEVGGFLGKNIISVVIPASVNGIGAEAFANCSNLTSIVIPASVNGIGAYAFANCSNLTSIVIPANVKEIGLKAFQNCSNLTSVDFKGKEVIIEEGAFGYCGELNKLVFSGTLKPLEYNGKIGWEEERIGNNVYRKLYTEHYFYRPSSNARDGSTFYFHSGANAFFGCDKLPPATLSKLKEMGFLEPEEIRELEGKARRREL